MPTFSGGGGSGVKFEKYAEINIPAGGTYTPADPGFYMAMPHAVGAFRRDFVHWEIYISTDDSWVDLVVTDGSGTMIPVFHVVSDGTNVRLRNSLTTNSYNVVILRMG